ncbi:hypothetical protein CDO44_24540 [Pigmentiphaga sp. NML080357]|uniref:Bug family tripartite tricarboxylate transporter substrate binding protein n=1 Tax=Pigmentiphaga sp. NML080357 TaxID=2008675 RepID=UPI000B41B7EE|nr:tripartite tricarboxylate transporter substrate binding protein [Pigmentiphaga sp. NML080357]OVZ55384.1 hypothetical protein CDO44_24540 [Pigmentiphaga sp. NML080357]
MNIERNFLSRALIALSVLGLSSIGHAAAAETYPRRTVSIVVPFPAGGPADGTARVLQPAMREVLGQTVIVENFSGAGGSIGVGKVLAAPPDGHTLLLTTLAEPILPPRTLPSVTYRPEDLKLVTQLSHTQLALVARPDAPFKNLKELLAHTTGKGSASVNYATPGSGTLYHLVSEHFRQLTGAALTHVPYRGIAPEINDLLGSQVDVAFLPLAGNLTGFINQGKLRLLGTSGTGPVLHLDRAPSLRTEAALKDFDYTVWTGVFVHKDTPDAVVDKVRAAVDAAMKKEAFQSFIRESGGIPLRHAQSAGEAGGIYAREVRRLEQVFDVVRLKGS